MANPQVVGIGATNLDYCYRVPEIVKEGEVPVEEFRTCPGGSAANTIYGLARLGVSTGFVGAVGWDEEGKQLIADLARAGVDTSPIRVKAGAPTGRILALVDASGRRALYALPGANNLLSPEDVDINYINRAGFLHLSPFVGEAQFQLQRQLLAGVAPQVRVSFAPGALYSRLGLKALAPFLARTHIMFLNREEIEQFTGKVLPQAARACLEAGCAMVIVTSGGGEEVCQIYEAGAEYRLKPHLPPPRVVDTTGAGDAFAAGFLFGLLQGKNLEQCGLMAEIMALSCISQLGARTGLPSRGGLEGKFRELFPL